MLLYSNHASLADLYLDRLAFDWQRRCRQAGSHVLGFSTLLAADEAMAACAHALPLLGPAVAGPVQSRLDDALLPGEMFAVSLYALDTHDLALQARCLDLAQALPRLRAALAAALQWSSPQAAQAALLHWPQSNDLADVMALLACAAHPPIAQAVTTGRRLRAGDSDMLACARLECALYTGDARLAADAPAHLHAHMPLLRCLAAEAMLVLQPHPPSPGRPAQRAIEVLQDQALDARSAEARIEHAALILAVQHPPTLAAVLPTWAQQPARQRLYLQALAWLGDLAAVPVLIEHLDHPTHARIAGAALALLTGSQPARDGWQAPPDDGQARSARDASPAHDADIAACDPDAELPTPDRAGFATWWVRHRPQFDARQPYLAGLPMTPGNLLRVLHTGRLAWRALAASRLQSLQPGARLATDIPAQRQQQALHALHHSTAHHDHRT